MLFRIGDDNRWLGATNENAEFKRLSSTNDKKITIGWVIVAGVAIFVVIITLLLVALFVDLEKRIKFRVPALTGIATSVLLAFLLLTALSKSSNIWGKMRLLHLRDVVLAKESLTKRLNEGLDVQDNVNRYTMFNNSFLDKHVKVAIILLSIVATVSICACAYGMLLAAVDVDKHLVSRFIRSGLSSTNFDGYSFAFGLSATLAVIFVMSAFAVMACSSVAVMSSIMRSRINYAKCLDVNLRENSYSEHGTKHKCALVNVSGLYRFSRVSRLVIVSIIGIIGASICCILGARTVILSSGSGDMIIGGTLVFCTGLMVSVVVANIVTCISGIVNNFIAHRVLDNCITSHMKGQERAVLEDICHDHSVYLGNIGREFFQNNSVYRAYRISSCCAYPGIFLVSLGVAIGCVYGAIKLWNSILNEVNNVNFFKTHRRVTCIEQEVLLGLVVGGAVIATMVCMYALFKTITSVITEVKAVSSNRAEVSVDLAEDACKPNEGTDLKRGTSVVSSPMVVEDNLVTTEAQQIS